MIDLKQFLDKNVRRFFTPEKEGSLWINKDDLGLFFWERGGKQFIKVRSVVKECKTIEDYVIYAHMWAGNSITTSAFEIGFARDFLDALACLGEEKVKELIKECVGK
jgi:hypothetical protein